MAIATESQQAQVQAAATDAVAAAAVGRKVVDEVSGWLRVFDDGTVDRTWTGPPEVLPLMQPVPAYAEPRDGHTLHDLPGEPNLRVYLPEVALAERRLPVVVQLHGGGFCISHPSWLMYHHFYARLACALPAVVVAVELPLAPERRLPAHIDTGVEGLPRVRSIALSDAAALGDPAAELLRTAADFSRVFLIGDSSGGNLVHHVGARQVGAGAEARLGVFTLDMLDKFLAMALPEGATKDHPYTCPMGPNAPPLESVPLPPLLVAVAEHDLIRDTNLEYCDALRTAGKDVEVLVNRGMSHSFYLNKYAVDMDPATGERTRELVDAIKSFVDRH
ncbi:hypothetical protein OsJ_18528 [Oryza sativa Japonica Group]|uniref:Alpha/beta hydrolase fold-3 domain-containing protein n=1 Tax=Oryza sativa subsp. japonica TaxID=39947 RepID=B9FPK6_ORYSJ|nr:hypothetical protein OsJ_18528 [Oryza sativa Japonica Group]